MRRARKEVVIFNLSMLDVMTGALGAVLTIVIVLLTQKISIEEESSPIKLAESATALTDKALQLQREAVANKDAALQKKAREIADNAKDVASRMAEMTSGYAVLEKKEAQLKAREQNLEELKKQLEALKKQLSAPDTKPADSVGFNIPKRVLFVLDLSGSMLAQNNRYKEDRISQVKAALKMFVAGMDAQNQIDLVFFPAFKKNVDGACKDFVLQPSVDSKCLEFERMDDAYDDSSLACYKYGYFSGQLQPMVSDRQKYEFYQKLACLDAYHATPTKSALEFALDHPEYQNAQGIILFSDGEPDAIKEGRQTVDGLVKAITSKNGGKKRVFTVGVGKEFREQSKTKAVAFLKQLAEQNNGFFLGF